MDQFNLSDFYDYERWPGDWLNRWLELRLRMPDNASNPEEDMDYDITDDVRAGGLSYLDPGAERPMAAGGHQLSENEARMLHAANGLRLYYTPGVTALGLLGGLLALPLFARVSRATRSSHGPYVVALCVCTLLFFVGLLLTWLGSVGVNVYGVPGTCQFTAFISQASHFLYTWVLVALTADRLAAQLLVLEVCPWWLAIIDSPNRARILILVLAVLALATFLNLSMLVGTVHLDTVRICVVIIDYLRTSLLLDKIDAVLNFFLPFLMLVVTDVVLIFNHCRIKLRRVPLEIIGDAYLSTEPLHPAPGCSTGMKRDAPRDDHQRAMVPAESAGRRARVAPSISSIIATVCTSGVFVTFSLPSTIQRTVSTFADDHLLFSMTARGILYQHTFANLFYTAFLGNIVLMLAIDADIRRETKNLLRQVAHACFRYCPNMSSRHEAAYVETGSDNECPNDMNKGTIETEL